MAGKVILNKNVYRTIIGSCVRYANARIPEEDWLEIYGILIGHHDKKKNIIVSEAYPITHTMKKGHILKVSYDDPDYVDASLIEEEAYTRDPPEFIIGWYHSHPGIKVMFSQDDVKNQLGYQSNNPLAIGLVFNHVRLVRQVEVASRKGDPNSPLMDDPGFKIFRLKDPNRGIEASYDTVDYEFSDAKITPAFIEEAKSVVADVTKLLPKDDLVESTKANFEKQLAKITEIYDGTESYIKTLIKKGETSRIPNVIETQKQEVEKIIRPMEDDLGKLRELMHFVEYKERGETINTFNEVFDNWKNSLEKLMNQFNALSSEYV